MSAPLGLCPFCQSQLRVNSYSKRIGKACPHVFETAQIKCKRQSCGFSGPLIKGENSRARCIDAWAAWTTQHDALAAHVAAAVAEARAEDAADSFAMLIADARAEAERAMTKFPQPNYVISKFAEEAGEVVKAAIHCAENRETADNVRGEMKQAIAMLYRLWVEGDQVHGLQPLAQIGAKP